MSRGWDRSDRPAAKSPEDIFDELNRRELADIETCRHVWEGEDDPLAVVVAVIHAGLPKWLTDALLFLLTDGAAPPVPGVLAHRKRLWRDRTRALSTPRARGRRLAIGSIRGGEADLGTRVPRR